MKDWKISRFNFIPEPSFDDEWKPTDVFLALRLKCTYFTGMWERDDTTKEGQPILVHCTHSDNPNKEEGNCNVDTCPLLKK